MCARARADNKISKQKYYVKCLEFSKLCNFVSLSATMHVMFCQKKNNVCYVMKNLVQLLLLVLGSFIASFLDVFYDENEVLF